jgi:hypothetical protein
MRSSILLFISASSATMSEFENEDGVFDISLWMSLTGITEKGVKLIENNQINNLATLLLFQPEDVDALRLNVGDALRFKSGIASLRLSKDKPPGLVDKDGKLIVKDDEKKDLKETLTSSSGERVFSLHEVEQLLAGKGAVIAGASGSSKVTDPSSLSALLASDPVINASLSSLLAKPADNTVSQVRDLMRDLLNFDDVPVNSRGEKVLLPINFLSCVRGTQDNEEVVHSGKGQNLVLQSNLNRVRPEKLTAGQWISANARIMNKLITSGSLTTSTLNDYLEYTRKLGDLLQLYTPSSVFLLDHHHRVEVHESITRKWSDIDCTLENAHLKRKDNVQTSSTVAQGSKNGSSASFNGGVRRPLAHVNAPCWAFNSSDGCRFTKEKCRYNHIESVDSNPRQGGYEKAPRFQKGGRP